jgi:Glycosyltransferase family 87
MTARLPPGFGRRVVASLWAAVAMPFMVLALVVPVARALGMFESIPIPAVAVLSVVAGPILVALLPWPAVSLPESLDRWFPEHRGLATLWVGGGLIALLLLGRMSVFLADPSQVGCSIAPTDPTTVRHSCLTAYVHGAILSTDPTANVYDLAFVPLGSDVFPPVPPTAARFAPFTLDSFGYPPPFLLLPRALMLVTTDFLSQRILFSAASLVLALFACASVAKTLGGAAERRIWLLTPVFMISPPVMITIQWGNFHLAAVALCMLCWVALERRQDGLTGTLLAAATLAKIFPGVLGVVILMQRRWRAAAFTCLAAAAFCALSVAVLGTKVWHDFLFYHLPLAQSGEAFRFMADAVGTRFNLAPFGIPFKLGALGLEGWGWPQTRLFGNIFIALLFALAAMAGRNSGSRQHRLTVWLGVVMLASLLTPFAGVHVLSAMAMLLLVLATEVRSPVGLAAFVAITALASLPTPALSDPRLLMAAALGRAVVIYLFLVWVVLRRELESVAIAG